ncbi:hypothetical protein TWF106_003654 [Orbilia oligospora]|uniref:Uncharacterized protein n=1 Tax=Orbilia oligospora TaxID=2813651 RepID=A0A6G1LQY4_ORBOL|nr:hypothetical protein TWF679_003641 [Orbilia oligospora]KAF3224690.1 hypothetical protein TWF106_003654 [Orbilia oligospora]KAF3229093.1 hypothetical protein TWF191_001646 [Orbilia oligospora]KAF3232115.1 hypothetical protein TWF192_003348 [Orbilia oligospora]
MDTKPTKVEEVELQPASNIPLTSHPAQPRRSQRIQNLQCKDAPTCTTTSPPQKRQRLNPRTPPRQILWPYTPIVRPLGPMISCPKEFKGSTVRVPRGRRPIGSVTAARIEALNYRCLGTPPRRPKFGNIYEKEESKLHGLDWSQLPDINAPRKLRPPKTTPTTPTKPNKKEYTSPPSAPIAKSRSPNIILEDYDSDGTMDEFIYYVGSSPTTLVFYRTMMRRHMKKQRGGCGHGGATGGSSIVLAAG